MLMTLITGVALVVAYVWGYRVGRVSAQVECTERMNTIGRERGHI